MATTDPIKAVVWQGSDPLLMARLSIPIANVVTRLLQAHVGSITLKAFDGSTQITPTLTLDKTAVIYDTLQTSSAWTKDATGFNFAYLLDGTVYLPVGDLFYSVFVYVTLTGGEMYPVDFELRTRKVKGLS